MFHIKEDLRAYKSAELLCEGLEQLMKEKAFDKITITDITTESTVSRATFYRNFDTVIDVLYWKCDQLFKTVLTDYVSGEPDLTQPDSLIFFVFHFWMKHTDILELLIQQGRCDIIFNSFFNNADIVMDYIQEKISIPAFNYRYFISSRVGVFVGIFQAWIDGGKKESLEELVQILSDQYYTIGNAPLIF